MDGNLVAAQMNGGMRPPNAHPGQPFNGQLNQQMMRQQQQQQAGQGGAPMNWQAGLNGQPMPPQGPQPQVQGATQQRSMPPPSAPAAANNSANSRNATSSPQTATAAPPTPQQASKANPKKKDTKSAKSKVGCRTLIRSKLFKTKEEQLTLAEAATQKKANATINAAATPAAEPAADPEPPTPATPITPVAPQAFNSKGQNAAASQMVPNGQQAAQPPPPPAPVAPQPQPDLAQPFNLDPSGGMVSLPSSFPTFECDVCVSAKYLAQDFDAMTFANPLVSDNVLTDFDFDSFLHENAGDDGATFDFNNSTYLEGDGIGAE